MKILIVSFLYPSIEDEVFGIFVHQHVKALRDLGIEVKVVSPVPFVPFPFSRVNNKWRAYAHTPRKDIIDGIEVDYPRFLSFPKGHFYEYKGYLMYKGIKQTLEHELKTGHYDIIHVHRAFPDGFATMLASKKHGKPLVITLHGMNMTSTIYKSKKCKESIAKVFSYADRVVTNSTKLRDIAVREIGYADKIAVIPNGIDETEICKGSAIFSLPEDARIILSVSHLIFQKGISINLKAFSKLLTKYPNLFYIIIGEGPEERQIKRLIEDLGIEDHVIFLGKKPHAEVLRYMAGCEIFSMPSWDEGFGVVYLEAMAHGKPVIGGQGEGIEDVIDHKKDGLLVKTQDADSLAEALDYLLRNPERAREIGENGRKKVLGNYTWKRNAELYIEIYKSILDT